ncbi:MAG: hypothetical protein JSR46_01515 [Verrucomicrobia bacterium]|nr:hypothetical protein [Verrucomicrobiota bacterium]
MRYIIYTIAFLLSFASVSPLTSAVKQVKIGDYEIDGFTKNKRLILDDGNVYRIRSNKDAVSTWLLGDTIMVLRGLHPDTFTLVNKRTGEEAKAAIVTL